MKTIALMLNVAKLPAGDALHDELHARAGIAISRRGTHNLLTMDTSPVTSAERRPVILEPMSDSDFSAFVETTVPAYAAEKVASGQWPAEPSLDLARKALEDLLPQGRATAGHHLFRITDSSGRSLGTLWLAEIERAGKQIAYLYDIWVRPECRRQGYALDALKAAEVEARDLGLSGIGLHVFGHNAGARLLYEKLGYQTTNLNMFKAL
jgi:ribosomal protein S18 acetylase RimI-like enzyme